VLKEYIARGTYIFPPKPSLRLIADIFAYCRAEIPKWNTISISGYHMAEAGASPAQEIAFTLADGIEYVRTAVAAGLDVDDFAPRLSFFFVARTTLLEEVAKFRAARRIWARVMREEFGAKNPKSLMLRFHTQTAGVQLTAQQPEVNLVRVASRALARCSAAPSRCTPTPSTRRSRCRPTRAPASRCAPSRCSRTRRT
jgi:methylmalonyl-CoA mutase N-terminal domain/subunit